MIGGTLDGFTHEPGAMLRAAREAKSFDLAKMAADLRVPAAVVEAMEDNRFEVFDAPLYAKGFLRKYAGLLELDSAVVIAAYEGRAGGPSEPTHIPVTPAAPRIRLRTPLRYRMPTPRLLSGMALVVMLLAAAYWYSGYRTDKLPSASAVMPSELKPEQAVPPTVAKDSEPPSQVSQAIPVQNDVTDSSLPANPARSAALPDATSDEITISGVRDAWVEVRGTDGGRLFYDHVRAGELRSVRAPGPWRIYLSDVDAVEIRLGAHVVDVPAARRTGTEARFGLKPNGVIL